MFSEIKTKDGMGRSQVIRYTIPNCHICSYQQTPPMALEPVRHKHFSTRQLRILTGIEDNGGLYHCPSCRNTKSPGRVHGFNRQDRTRIVVSSSTLHNYYLGWEYEGDDTHIDYCTIPGAVE